MRTRPKLIGCPQCNALTKCSEFVSGSTNGATYWTDGKLDAPMLPNIPLITRCRACSRLFWIADAPEKDMTILAEGAEVWSSEWRVKWRELEWVQDLTEADFLEAIEQKMARTDAEDLNLRLQAWWASNDHLREQVTAEPLAPRDPQRSPAAIANLFSLKELLKTTDTNQRRMKAEAARELGQFDQVGRILTAKPSLRNQMNERERFAAAFVQHLARLQESIVRKIPFDSRKHLEFHLPIEVVVAAAEQAMREAGAIVSRSDRQKGFVFGNKGKRLKSPGENIRVSAGLLSTGMCAIWIESTFSSLRTIMIDWEAN
jgi:hypothetical protein